MSEYRSAWPASAIGPEEMTLLHSVREAHPDRPPITCLIVQAVRAVYGQSEMSVVTEAFPDRPEADLPMSA